MSCKVLAVLNQYTSTSNYFWMLCEGIYLHTLIVVAVFVGEQQLFWYYVVGWGESGGSDIPLNQRMLIMHFLYLLIPYENHSTRRVTALSPTHTVFRVKSYV